MSEEANRKHAAQAAAAVHDPTPERPYLRDDDDDNYARVWVGDCIRENTQTLQRIAAAMERASADEGSSREQPEHHRMSLREMQHRLVTGPDPAILKAIAAEKDAEYLRQQDAVVDKDPRTYPRFQVTQEGGAPSVWLRFPNCLVLVESLIDGLSHGLTRRLVCKWRDDIIESCEIGSTGPVASDPDDTGHGSMSIDDVMAEHDSTGYPPTREQWGKAIAVVDRARGFAFRRHGFTSTEGMQLIDAFDAAMKGEG